MNPDRIRSLAKKYIDGTATDEEKQLLHQWYDNVNAGDTEMVMTEDPVTGEQLRAEILAELKAKMGEHKIVTISRRRISIWKAAAIIALPLILVATAYLVWNNTDTHEEVTEKSGQSELHNDIPPGGNKALLILANGSSIILDSVANGVLAQQGNINVVKSYEGLLTYNGKDGDPYQQDVFNTITTPRAGQYQVQLSDGSKVWLNAASSLRFPVSFSGHDRQVELTGEGYFEIAKNPASPFQVIINGRDTVEVLGTHFNVMAYEDEPAAKTTLLEGAIRLKSNSSTAILRPGQEGSINNSGQIKLINNASTDEAIAWKNGLIKMSMADVGTVMRQISRWYDVEIIYEKNIPSGHIEGTVSRNVNLSNMVRLLEVSGVRCRIEGKTLKVLAD